MVWEERWHPLRREWVVISSHRDTRPWLGETVGGVPRTLPAYVPDCYLCPGNERSSGARNANYSGVYVFDNDHPCVGPAAPGVAAPESHVFQNRQASGVSRVVCFTPRHDLTLAEMSQREVAELLAALQAQYRDLASRPDVRCVLMFENKGDVVGVSNPHPHCQIYATNFVFKTLEIEADACHAHLAAHGRALMRDIIEAEEEDGRRLLVTNDAALSFVPYFARYPYETYVAPRATHPNIGALGDREVDELAATLRETLIRLDNVWRMSMPYVMVLHQAPLDQRGHRGFHFHIQIHPPLRKPGLLKYLAGPEIGGGNFLNDTAPEAKAAELRAVSATHYREDAASNAVARP